MIKYLSEEERKYLKKERYKKNQIIRAEGELCDEIFYIEQGEIIISTLTLEDKEVIINHLTKGQVFGNILIYSSKPYYLGDVLSLNNSIIYSLKKKYLDIILEKNAMFREHFISSICEESLKTRRLMKLYSIKDNRQRLLYYLHQKKQENNSSEIRINSVTELSKILSLPRESCSRLLSKLEKEKIIEKNGKIVSLL